MDGVLVDLLNAKWNTFIKFRYEKDTISIILTGEKFIYIYIYIFKLKLVINKLHTAFLNAIN